MTISDTNSSLDESANINEPSFKSLGLSSVQCQALTRLNYASPTPIQIRCIPPLLKGQNLLGQAKTGTGKTAAFALPLLNRIDLQVRRPQVLVLAPTRELALQVSESFKAYAKGAKGIEIVPIFGGQSFSNQLGQLKRGPQVVIGTPGRVIDHLNRGSLILDSISAVVLDEADEMLKMGFIEDVEQILSRCPDEKQVALFSATMPPQIRAVAERHLKYPVEISIPSTSKTGDLVDQFFWQVPARQKVDAVASFLELEEHQGVIIFVRTRVATSEISNQLKEMGHKSAPLNGDMNQHERERTIAQLKSGKLDVIVATDVAARGIDVNRITHVINLDVPFDPEAYVHRIGRTGRAGRRGKAILIVSPNERRFLRAIEKSTGAPIKQLKPPTRSEIIAHRHKLLSDRITRTVREQDLSNETERVLKIMEEQNLTAIEIASALVTIDQVTQNPLPPEIVTRFKEHQDDWTPSRSPRGRRERKEKDGKRHPSSRRKSKDKTKKTKNKRERRILESPRKPTRKKKRKS